MRTSKSDLSKFFDLPLAALLLFLLFSAGFSADQKVAAYSGLPSDEFMQKWLICEPIPVFPLNVEKKDMELQKKVFETALPDFKTLEKSVQDGKMQVHLKSYKWKKINSKKKLIDLIDLFGQKDFVYVYAFTQVELPDSASILMGLGSDDGVMVWLNGQLVHQNWIGRAVNQDNDLITLHFKKGINTLLLKVQNMEQGWGFMLRPVGEKTLPEMLMTNISAGRLKEVKMLADKVDVNSVVEPGITPLHLAKMSGQQQIVDLLLEKGADPSIPMPPKEKMADYLFTRAIKDKYPGASALVARDGKIIYQRGFGLANIKKSIPIEPKTTFRIGSITKQFTAAAILKLQEKGLLSVKDPLKKYLPDFPQGDVVTIHHLLTHISGIQSYTSTPNFIKKVTKPISTTALVQDISKLGYIFKPGESWSYNNSGFFILGYIIEKVSGKSFDDFLKQEFFEPFGMKNTGVYTKGLNLPAEAYGYAFENDRVNLAMDWDMSHAGGAGNLYSHVEDLFRWNEAIFNGKALADSSFKAAMTPVKLNNGEPANAMGGTYGYGWALSNFRGLKAIGHGGGLHGFNTQLTRFPEKNVTIVVLSNCLPNLPELSPGALANKLAEIFFWEEMETREANIEVILTPELLKSYTGRFDYTNAGIMEVTFADNHLYAQLTGQPRFEIFPRGENQFFWKVVDAWVEFVKDDQGVVTHAIHHQGGGTLKAMKLKEKTAVKIDTKLLDEYAGKYELMPKIFITFTREGEQFWTQLTGQPKFEIFPESDTDFFLKVVNAQVKFVRNEKGKVDKIILTQGGIQREAKKVD